MKKRGLRTAIDYLKAFRVELIPEVLHRRAGIDVMVHTLSHSLRREARGGNGRVVVAYHPDNSGTQIAYYRANPDYKAPERPVKTPSRAPALYFYTAMGCKAFSPYFPTLKAARRDYLKRNLAACNFWTGNTDAPILVDTPLK